MPNERWWNAMLSVSRLTNQVHLNSPNDRLPIKIKCTVIICINFLRRVMHQGFNWFENLIFYRKSYILRFDRSSMHKIIKPHCLWLLRKSKTSSSIMEQGTSGHPVVCMTSTKFWLQWPSNLDLELPKTQRSAHTHKNTLTWCRHKAFLRNKFEKMLKMEKNETKRKLWESIIETNQTQWR